MRITNTQTFDITLADLDRGNVGSNDVNTSILESWNTKADNGVPAGGSIDVFDSDKTMLSAALGQVKKYKDAGWLTTEYSVTGKEVGSFELTNLNNQFAITIDSGSTQSFTFPTGTVTMAQVVSTINATATGFATEESSRFFRSSNTDDTAKGKVEGSGGDGEGQRTEAILEGFLVLVSGGVIEIKAGSANDVLGFHEKQKTLAK